MLQGHYGTLYIGAQLNAHQFQFHHVFSTISGRLLPGREACQPVFLGVGSMKQQAGIGKYKLDQNRNG